MLTRFRSQLASVILAAVLLATGYFFLGTFGKYLQLRAEFRSSQKTLKLLKAREREIDLKRRILVRVKSFVDKAQTLGLERWRWDTYEVDIKEPVTFAEAADILNQTVNTKGYFFKPVHLHIAKDLKAGGETDHGENSLKSKMPQASGTGDIYLNLKGSFLARAR
jgi:hypothetical protein